MTIGDKRKYKKVVIAERAKFNELSKNEEYLCEPLKPLKQAILNNQATSSVERTKFTSPNPPTKDSNYSRMYQDAGTTKLLMTTSKAGVKHNTLTDTGIINITHGETQIEVMLKEYGKSISQGCMKLLAIMIQRFTQGHPDIISIPIKELAELLGKKNIKKAREAIKEELGNIRNLSVKIDGRRYVNTDICQWAMIENSIVSFEFNNMFKAYLLKCNIMPINMKLFQIPCSRQENPYVLCIGLKIYFQANFNHYKNDNRKIIISVKTLLETCSGSGLPTYEEVMKKTRQVGRLIIEPMQANINVLVHHGIIGDFYYVNKEGDVIKDYDEILNEDNPKDSYSIAKDKDYSEWFNRNVVITMPTDYIDEIAPHSKKKAAAQVKLTPNRRKYAK